MDQTFAGEIAAQKVEGVMSAPNHGGPAFPTTEYYDERPYGIAPGMTLRDYFAAAVLQGLVANLSYNADSYERLVAFAYAAADAMIERRQR
jgi:hypothetical protein